MCGFAECGGGEIPEGKPAETAVTDLIERLNHARATAANDDHSEPMSEKRARHVERMAAMEAAEARIAELEAMGTTQAAIDLIAANGQLLERIAKLDAEVARLREAVDRLRPRVRHDGLCGLVGGYGYCTCGLDALTADIDRRAAESSRAALAAPDTGGADGE